LLHALATHRARLRPACFAILAAILLASASTNAATRPRGVGVRLEYQRGPGARQCPDAKGLRGEVAAEIGTDPFTEAGPWRLRAAVTRAKNGAFVASAELFDGDGGSVDSMGEQSSRDCRALILKVVAVWASVVLTDPPPPPDPPPPDLPPPPPPPPPFRLRLGATTGIELGVGPTPTPLFALSLAVQSTQVPISLAFEVRTDLPLLATVESGERVHAWVITGSLLGCFHAVNEGLFFLCPMFTAGRASGGARFSVADASGIYSAAGGRVGVAIPFASRRFAFTFAGDVLGALHPFRLRFAERPLWQTGDITGALQTGVSALF
jgi:hypothetical protein